METNRCHDYGNGIFFVIIFSNFQPIKKVEKQNNIQSYNPIFFSGDSSNKIKFKN